MRIAIVEDHPAEALWLKEKVHDLLPGAFGLTDIDTYESADAFLLANKYYDLMLIDCQLPDRSGVQLAKEIRKTNTTTAFIFTTAYMEFAAEGYETDAMRYLLKPIDEEKLREALLRFLDRIQANPVVELTGTTRFAEYANKLDIFYLEYVERKVVVRLKNASVESHKSMKSWEHELGTEFFFRTSQRFLVNFKHITEKRDTVLIMENGERVVISGRKLMAFNQAYIRFLKRS